MPEETQAPGDQPERQPGAQPLLTAEKNPWQGRDRLRVGEGIRVAPGELPAVGKGGAIAGVVLTLNYGDAVSETRQVISGCGTDNTGAEDDDVHVLP